MIQIYKSAVSLFHAISKNLPLSEVRTDDKFYLFLKHCTEELNSRSFQQQPSVAQTVWLTFPQDSLAFTGIWAQVLAKQKNNTNKQAINITSGGQSERG